MPVTFSQELPIPPPDTPEPSKSIILCTDERTGSHLLAQHMATTGVLGRPYEYFNTAGMQFHYPNYPDEVGDQFKCARYLSTTPNGVFSLKMHWWAMERVLPSVKLFDAGDIYFVHLIRDDLLGQAISLLKASQTNVWASSRQSLASASTPQYDGARLFEIVKDLAARRNKWEVYFTRNAISPLRFTYEFIASRPQAAIDQIAEFADIREPAVLGKEDWYTFERQADQTNDAWRNRFLSEYGGLYKLN